MKKLFLFISFIIIANWADSQNVGIKTNLLYDAATSMNLGVEFKMAPKWTMELSGIYNPWTFSENKKIKHWMVQPEAKWWLCERFSGHFFAVHALGGQFNVGGMLPFGFKNGKMFGFISDNKIMNNRYQGWMSGAGIGYGYQWILKKRWGIELSLGLGYAYLKYDKYKCTKCGEKLMSSHKNYFGPTKIAASIIYIIK